MLTSQLPLPRLLLQAMLLAINLACSTGNALAIGTQDDLVQSPLIGEFRKLDRNSDGKLSSTEASRDNDIAQQFSKADSNHDGALSADEYGNFKSAAQQARVAAYLDDSSVTARVKADLIKESGIESLSISVQTYHGCVILSGFVDNAQQARRAMEIASAVRGVNHVSNSLLLKEEKAPAARALRIPLNASQLQPRGSNIVKTNGASQTFHRHWDSFEI